MQSDVVETEVPRALRADAERNRRRLIAAASEMFSERGLDVGVAEIAERAGVGRGTLFRNFPTKQDLIAAIVVERMRESVARGQAALEAPDPGEALFELIENSAVRSQSDRALFDALTEEWLARPEIHAVHAEMLETLDALLTRAQAAGSVRADIGAVDVVMLIKGVCEVQRSFSHVSPAMAERQLDLVRSAIATEPSRIALRGERPTLADLEHHPEPAQAGASSEPAGR
jgi:AcrR family transcriptional regulator